MVHLEHLIMESVEAQIHGELCEKEVFNQQAVGVAVGQR